jgi:hypothetical protein
MIRIMEEFHTRVFVIGATGFISAAGINQVSYSDMVSVD